ncbi:hypothetical protein [Ensifer soli]|uniref:hypothetical protein n=1 Tax=Ciceribacter sp. sgz301302 TaxID=3342379 RepID=UPI0035B9D7BC
MTDTNTGGSWVRQPDGSLKRVEGTEQLTAHELSRKAEAEQATADEAPATAPAAKKSEKKDATHGQ